MKKNNTIYRENFDQANLSPDLTWFNQPDRWKLDRGCLAIYPGKTDFWQRTHYGFSFDNGHALFYQAEGDFTLTTKVRFGPKHQYDQAGLMVRANHDFWLKTSVEYENNELSRLGVVVTNFGYSDWSTQDFDPKINEIQLKISKTGSDYEVGFRTGHTVWSQLRIAHIHQKTEFVHCGLYACSPVDVGFKAEFDFLEIEYM